jgi:hypothetical protein
MTANLAAPERPSGTAPPPVHGNVPLVTREERHRLAMCCAFFQAARFREAQPGSLRQSDVDIALKQIEDILKALGAHVA